MAWLPDEISPQKSDAIHRALLTGLLSNVGVKTEGHEYNGARGAKFSVFPGSTLFKRTPRWIVAAELVETTRLYARTLGPIRPEWIERAAAHLVRRTYSEPTWNAVTAHVTASEKVSLHSLVIVPSRQVHYGPINPALSREMFIHHALVLGEYRTRAEFFKHNADLRALVQKMEDKARRKQMLADEPKRFRFFNQRIPAGIYNGPLFEAWRREAEKENPRLLFMSLEDMLADDVEPIPAELYPDEIALPGLKLSLDYRFDTGSPADGITVTIPIAALGQVPAGRFEWLAPAYLPELIEELIRSLAKELRKTFIPIAQTARQAADALSFGEGSLHEGLSLFLSKRAGERVSAEAFRIDALPPWLRMNFSVVDAAGKPIAAGRDLAALRADLQVEVRNTFAHAPRSEHDRDNLTRWDFGDLPQRVPVLRHGMTLWGYPALIDRGESASIRLMESPEASAQATRAGARRLFMIQLHKEIEYLSRHIPNIEKLCLDYSTIGAGEELRRDLLGAIVDRALFFDGEPVLSQNEFIRRATDGWRRLTKTADEMAALAGEILAEYQAIQRPLATAFAPAMQPAARDMRDQFANLVYKGFLTATPFEWLRHLPRYLRAIGVRLRKLSNAGLLRDSAAMAEVLPLWEGCKTRGKELRRLGRFDSNFVMVRWMIEELRVSLFAQEMKTSMPVSVQRIQKLWEQVPTR